MVAKDFTLQQTVLPLTPIWVECHERMARFFILMDHKMQAEGSFRGFQFTGVVIFKASAHILFCAAIQRTSCQRGTGSRTASPSTTS
jgi:hypothetical protein